MNNIVHAWKDETYQQRFFAEGQVMLSANPAGETELTDAELEAICGAGINDPDTFNIPNSAADDPRENLRSGSLPGSGGNGTQANAQSHWVPGTGGYASTYATSSSTTQPAGLPNLQIQLPFPIIEH